MCDEPEWPKRGGTFQMYDIPESSNQASCLKCMRLRNFKKEGVLQIYDETLSPNEGACLRYMMNRCRQVSVHV